MSVTRDERLAWLGAEYAAYRQARADGDIADGWRHLERAHIVAQPLLLEHLRSHWLMLQLAMRERDLAESAGQVLRLLLAVPGNMSERLPTGNSGRAGVSALRSMPVTKDLERFVQ